MSEILEFACRSMEAAVRSIGGGDSTYTVSLEVEFEFGSHFLVTAKVKNEKNNKTVLTAERTFEVDDLDIEDFRSLLKNRHWYGMYDWKRYTRDETIDDFLKGQNA